MKYYSPDNLQEFYDHKFPNTNCDKLINCRLAVQQIVRVYDELMLCAVMLVGWMAFNLIWAILDHYMLAIAASVAALGFCIGTLQYIRSRKQRVLKVVQLETEDLARYFSE